MCLCFTTKVVKITTPHQADFLSACQLEFGDFVIKEQRATNVLIQIPNVESLKVNQIIKNRKSEDQNPEKKFGIKNNGFYLIRGFIAI